MKSSRIIRSANQFPVVGIGASAGGLEAFKKLLSAIPQNSGMAFVLVQHLDPNHESLLPELLQKVANIPVLEISDDIVVEPNHIYVLPSNKMMEANDGVLELTPRPEGTKGKFNLPIDLFFTSLAKVHMADAIGVVLSGTASDGTEGLRRIKEYGGITFAQDQESAAYGSMPASAVKAGVVDYVLPPEKILLKILEISHKVYVNDKDEQKSTSPESDMLRQVISVIRARKGTDFTYYKQPTIQRRVQRRMALCKVPDMAGYLQYLKENIQEQDDLFQDFLIPVTRFFRDTKSFNHLSETVFPAIKALKENDSVRVWVAGCSTGEEAYSIAICFKEVLGKAWDSIQIFATDISESAIFKARKGIYTKNEVNSISAKHMSQFFVENNGSYQIAKQIRDKCVFAVHDFLRDPPLGKMDFISCRNVMIYMQPYLQKKALSTFHYALNPKGILFLGKTETIGIESDIFTVTERNNKIFSRKDTINRLIHFASQKSESGPARVPDHFKRNITQDFRKTADDIILGSYTPPGVIVNSDMDIVHFRGNTADYLAQTQGIPTHNLLKMARKELAFELRNLLHKSKKEGKKMSRDDISLLIQDKFHKISIEVIPLPDLTDVYYLILFHDTSHSVKETMNKGVKPAKDAKDIRIGELEQELAQTYEDMRSITEDQEQVNRNLQGDNEELLSTSEELQSLNEELETSKEELQSSNEELTVVNQEVIMLNRQLTDSRDYAEAIIATIREPLLVLDKHLRIKTANLAYYQSFGIKSTETEGKLIYEVDNRQWDIPALRNLLEAVIKEKSRFKDFEISNVFTLTGTRVLLLNGREMIDRDDEEKLILLTIQDVTDQRKYQETDRILLNRFRNMVDKAPVAICIFRDAEYIVELANERMLEFWGKNASQVMGKHIFESVPEIREQGFEKLLDTVYATKKRFVSSEFPVTIQRQNKQETLYVKFVFEPIKELNDEVSGIMVVADEITEEVLARKKMEVQAMMVETLLMTAPGFVFTLAGPDHVYKMVNNKYQQLVGNRKIKGKPMLKVMPELAGQGIDIILDTVYLTGKPFIGIEVPVRLARDTDSRPDLRYFNFSYQPIYDEHKMINGILVFGYEVTEEVNAKNKVLALHEKHGEELEQSVLERTIELSEANELLYMKNMELLGKNKELETFAYISSHDLQEPLRKIQIFSDRLLDKENSNLSETGKDHLKRMKASAAAMQQLINDLLAFASINNTKGRFQQVLIKDILEEVQTEMKDIIDKKKVIIDSAGLGKAKVIPFLFRQLLYNLIGNSIKFSKKGRKPLIVIKSKLENGSFIQKKGGRAAVLAREDEVYCHISVADNGIGFDPKFNEYIFEVFKKLHGKEEYTGTGIGLAIIKRIVDNHNGFILANGKLGAGATFDLYIPDEVRAK